MWILKGESEVNFTFYKISEFKLNAKGHDK